MVQENVKWIQKVLVNKLSLRRLSEVEFDASSLLQIPHWLKKLEFELDEANHVSSAAKANSILDLCNNLNELKISSDLFEYTRGDEPASEYEKAFIDFCEETLLKLNKKPNMKAFSIRMDEHPEYMRWFVDKPSLGVAGLYELPPTDTYSTSQFLTTLQIIDIQLIKLTTRELEIWKSFLDSQVRLNSLRVYIGFVHWEYFLTVLQNNYMTLKSVDIELSNFEDPFRRVPGLTVQELLYAAGQIPAIAELQESWLDWTELFSQNCRLKSISLYMPPMAWENRTKYFCSNWDSLEELKLHCTALTQEELSRFLLNLPLLRKISIQNWFLDLEIANFVEGEEFPGRERFREFLTLVSTALQLNHLDEIKVFQSFWDSYYSKDEVRQFLNHPNYVVTFPNRNQSVQDDVDGDAGGDADVEENANLKNVFKILVTKNQ